MIGFGDYDAQDLIFTRAPIGNSGEPLAIARANHRYIAVHPGDIDTSSTWGRAAKSSIDGGVAA